MLKCAPTVRVLALGLSGCLMLAAGPKEGRRAFQRGVKAERAGDYSAALEAFSEAYREDPGNMQYLTRREVARQRAAYRRVSQGWQWLERGRYQDAAREFDAALELDPSNQFARQQREAAQAGRGPQRWNQGSPPGDQGPSLLALRPRPVRRSWDLRGEVRELYRALGESYGIRFEFDDELGQQTSSLRLQEASFSEALRVVGALTKTFAAPLDEATALVASQTIAKRQQYERQVLKHLDASSLGTPEAINEVANMLRALLEMRFVAPNLAQKVITVRDSGGKVLAAEGLVRALKQGRAEVLIELQIVEVNARLARVLGLLPPQQSALFKLSPQMGRSQSGHAVPLPQIFGQAVPSAGGTLQQSLAAFGGGKTFFGVTIPGADFRATLSQSLLRSITAVHLRAAEGQAANFLAGSRFPIINAAFSAIFLAGAALEQQQQGRLLNPFPSFTFEDLGFKLKATPRVHADGDVTLALELQTRALSGRVLNGVPALSNREFQSQVRLSGGQTAILSGLLTRDERRSLAGLPVLAELPGLGLLFGQRSDERAESELLVLITPRVVRLGPSQLKASETIPFPTDYLPVAR